MTSKLAVIIGRFQTPYLHKGHLKLIEEAKSISNDILILIGCTAAVGTDKNPLDYKTRENMFYEAGTLSRHMILPLDDMPSDKDWSDKIDGIIDDLGYTEAIILGGRDNSIQGSYSGKHEVKIIEAHGNHSATALRKKAAQEPMQCSNFRSGIIYNAENRYPIVYSTVDVALVSDDKKILMGKKGNKFCFIGGFVDTKDSNLTRAAIRELREETGIVAFEHELHYYDSFKVDDGRYRNTKDCIMTHLFIGLCNEMPKQHKITDKEFTEFRYLCREDTNLVDPAHKYMFELLINQTNK